MEKGPPPMPDLSVHSTMAYDRSLQNLAEKALLKCVLALITIPTCWLLANMVLFQSQLILSCRPQGESLRRGSGCYRLRLSTANAREKKNRFFLNSTITQENNKKGGCGMRRREF